MKLLAVIIFALVAALARAVRVPEISANSPLGKNLLHHARRVEEANNEEAEEGVGCIGTLIYDSSASVAGGR